MNRQEKIELIGELVIKTALAGAVVCGFFFGFGGLAELICRLLGVGA